MKIKKVINPTQMNLVIPEKWKQRIMKISRHCSVELDKDFSHQDLMKWLIEKNLHINEDESEIDQVVLELVNKMKKE